MSNENSHKKKYMTIRVEQVECNNTNRLHCDKCVFGIDYNYMENKIICGLENLTHPTSEECDKGYFVKH